jgi:hypothetical protein
MIKVNWDFLFLSLQNRGFGNKWLMWMHMVVEGGTFSVSESRLEGGGVDRRNLKIIILNTNYIP